MSTIFTLTSVTSARCDPVSQFSIYPFFFLGSVLWDFCYFVVNVTYFIRVCLDSLFFFLKFYEDLYAVYLTDDQENLMLCR